MKGRLNLPIIVILILLILIIAIIGYIYNNTESYTTTVRKPLPYKVLSNPYLAAEYFLKEHQQQVTNRKHLNFFDNLATTKQTVLLLGERNHLSPSQNKKIFDWVAKGGQLIVEIDPVSDDEDEDEDEGKDSLLEELGIVLTLPDENKESLTKLYIQGEAEPIVASFSSAYALVDTKKIASLWVADDDDNIHLMAIPYKQGKITVISDGELWRNTPIKHHDHAWLLKYLTAGNDVVIVYNSFSSSSSSDHPNPFANLLNHFPYSFLALLLFIIALLWYKGTRSGPLEAKYVRDRRRLPEQLSAQANFLYKKMGAAQLLTILQQDINYLTKKRHPRFDDLAIDEQHLLISKLTDKPIELISSVMAITDQQKLSKLEFTKAVSALQAIRNAL